MLFEGSLDNSVSCVNFLIGFYLEPVLTGKHSTVRFYTEPLSVSQEGQLSIINVMFLLHLNI